MNKKELRSILDECDQNPEEDITIKIGYDLVLNNIQPDHLKYTHLSIQKDHSLNGYIVGIYEIFMETNAKNNAKMLIQRIENEQIPDCQINDISNIEYTLLDKNLLEFLNEKINILNAETQTTVDYLKSII